MDKVVGILGGGQLGRMLTEAANPLNIKIITLDKANAPAKQVLAHDQHIDGTFKSADDVRRLAARCDVLTVEIEHVDTQVLEELANEPGTKLEIHPSWKTIRLIQNKFHQKQLLRRQGIDVADFVEIPEPSAESVKQAAQELGGLPIMLKAQTDAYDGRGNFQLARTSDISKGLESLKDRPLYAEAWAPFRVELACMVVKTENSGLDKDPDYWRSCTLAYPAVETVHEDSICKLTYCPPRNVSAAVQEAARELARRAVATFEGRGIFGVELFLLPDDTLLVNEIAPRPHNSGHYQINATPMSQFEAHLYAILDLPIPPSDLVPYCPSIMLNILGGSTPEAHLELANAAIQQRAGKPYLYGKGAGTPGRKMGHIVVVAPSMSEAEQRMEPLIRLANRIQGKPEAASLPPAPTLAAPVVAVIMGSDSDLNVLKPGLRLLESFHIPTITTITSAHRTPARMAAFAEAAAAKGIKVLLAAAGGAAHLPGMAAAHTRLPVIGVPVKPSKGDGMDSLLSIVQMPRGCPVATVGIDNSVNAALLAVRILALEDEPLRKRLEEYLDLQRREVEAKAERMEAIGWEEYARGM